MLTNTQKLFVAHLVHFVFHPLISVCKATSTTKQEYLINYEIQNFFYYENVHTEATKFAATFYASP